MEYETLSVVGYRNGLWSAGSFFAGLSGFRLHFTDTDHKLMSVAVGGTNAESALVNHDYTLGFYDQSSVLESRDEFSGWSMYLNLESLPEEFVMGHVEGRGTTHLPIPPLSEGESFVLRGFTIAQTKAHDHNVRNIGVRLNEAGNSIAVTFKDDSPGDDGFVCKIVFGRAVNAREGYNMATQFFGPYTTERTFTESGTVPKEVPGKTLLTGFMFEYLDNDHFLREIKIDPSPDDHFDVAFTDNERDNPVKVTLDYLVVRSY